MSYLDSWIAVGMLGLIAVLIPLGMMFVSWLLRPSVPEDSKRATYESGEIPTGGTRIRFNIQYYMVALLFVVFDIETVLIFPWTVIYRDAISEGVGLVTILAPMLVFIGVLVVGLAWAWRNGAVEWARSPQAEERRTGRGRASDGTATQGGTRSGGGRSSTRGD
jgi:NADH-quinone oxidoreductase subunit A